MNGQYLDWIAANVTGDGYGKCKEVTEKMASAFPELTRVRGHYYCPWWGERAHWWLTTPDGDIVDPTKTQFPSRGMGHYEPWDETAQAPTGKCPNCSGYCYNHQTCCSDECHNAYAAYCMNPHYL
jgi:hypothetical protein